MKTHGLTSLLQLKTTILLCCTSLFFIGCAAMQRVTEWPAIEGVVTNAETGEPIADVYITARWRAYLYHGTACIHAEGTRSDANGRFTIPAWHNDTGHRDIKFQGPRAHKAGYMDVSKRIDKTEMAPFKGTREEYLVFLTKSARRSGCSSGGASRKNLYPLYEMFYYEAKEHSISREEIKHLEWFRYMAARNAIAEDEDLKSISSTIDEKVDAYLKGNLQ